MLVDTVQQLRCNTYVHHCVMCIGNYIYEAGLLHSAKIKRFLLLTQVAGGILFGRTANSQEISLCVPMKNRYSVRNDGSDGASDH